MGFGYSLKTSSDKAIAQSMNSLVQAIKGKNEQYILESLAIRTMAKAKYSCKNIGHYGLAFPFYTHFTSPIRRYPDLMVHRLLEHYLQDGKSESPKKCEIKCEHSSAREELAVQAERASIKYKQVEFLKDHIGEEFEGNRCECGSVFLVERTLKGQGEAYVEVMAFHYMRAVNLN